MQVHKLLFLAALTVLNLIVSAQSNSTQLTIFGGANLSKLRGNDVYKTVGNSTVNISAGVHANFNLKTKLHLVTGLHFEQLGTDLKNLVFSDPTYVFKNGIISDRLSYLTLPIFIEHSLLKNNFLYVEGGLFASYALHQAHQEVYTGNMAWMILKEGNRYKKFNGGIMVGVNAKFPLDKHLSLQAAIRNQLGLVAINRNSYQGTIKTNNINLTLGLTFVLN